MSTYTYHLQSEQTPGTVVSVWSSQIGFDALGYLVKEFWPDIHRKLHKPKTGQAR